jgi:NAD(P)-dependent dehydrogenase (short-subunit alcohol dehydrogenase family)
MKPWGQTMTRTIRTPRPSTKAAVEAQRKIQAETDSKDAKASKRPPAKLKQSPDVNAVAPGPVWTPLNPADRSAKDLPTFGASTDMKRPAQPEEISPAYVFLASSICSSYITGVVLPIMGSVPGG